jgi:2'-5' RNA ligase
MSTFSYACTMLRFVPESQKKLNAAWNYIKSSELAEQGFEEDLHVTIRWGLENFNFPEVYKAVESLTDGPFELIVEGIEVFDTKYGDCIHYRVKPNDTLINLRSMIEDTCECIPNKHDGYSPHITIAYVKKGLGESIADHLRDLITFPFTVITDEFTITDKHGKHSNIPLVNHRVIATEALLTLSQLNEHSVRVHIASGKLSNNRVKTLTAKLEELGGKVTQGKTGVFFKAPAKFGKTLIHKLWNTKGVNDHEDNLNFKYVK